MNNNSITKFLSYIALSLTLLFSINTAIASDYQYKVLDPRYNPRANELLEQNQTYKVNSQNHNNQKPFDLGIFLSLCALVLFPMVTISAATKIYRQLYHTDDSKQNIGNIKISRNDSITEKPEKAVTTQSINKNININKTIKRNTPNENKLPQNTNTSINKYFSSPIENKKPLLMNTSVLTKNKGICLVKYNEKYSLIGYINDNIFMLNQFNSLNATEIRTRLSETVDGKDRYLVRVGSFKSLVEVSDEKMELLLEL